jgi:hypothetical protein
VADLEQVRMLADPLRLKLLGAFGQTPRTTKQVAGILGEKPTKLYHHVEALQRAGLIELKETRPNRGTVEKYYQAVATRFEVPASLFALEVPGAEPSASPRGMLDSILESTRRELLDSLPEVAPADGAERQRALVARMIIDGPPERIDRLRSELIDWMEKWRAEEGEGSKAGEEGAQRYGLTVAFYPLRRPSGE